MGTVSVQYKIAIRYGVRIRVGTGVRVRQCKLANNIRSVLGNDAATSELVNSIISLL